MHEYIKTNINKEVCVVMELLVQKSVRCILSERGSWFENILIGGQPYVTVCDRAGGGYIWSKKCDIFLNSSYRIKTHEDGVI